MSRMPGLEDLPALLGTMTLEQRRTLSAILHHELNTIVAPFPSLLAAYPKKSDALLNACLTEALERVKEITTILRRAEEGTWTGTNLIP